MTDPLTAIVCLLVLILVSLWGIERRIERTARRAAMNPVDREMDELNPDGFSS